MHYTEIIAFLSLFVFMFLVILGFFGAFKCIVVIYQLVSSRIWPLRRKRADLSNLILQPVESTIYQVNVDDASLIAATQAIPLSRRRYIERKVEEKVLEEALIQRKNVLKSMTSITGAGGAGTSGSNSSVNSGGGASAGHSGGIGSLGPNRSILDYDLRCLTNIAEMQHLIHSCWTTNFGHRESLSEEERWIQKQVLKENLKIDNHVSTDPELTVVLDNVDPHFSTLLSAPTPTPPSNSPSPLHFHSSSYYVYPPAPAYNDYLGRRNSNSTTHMNTNPSTAGACGGDVPPPRFETLLIDHPDWPPSYETCIQGTATASTSSAVPAAAELQGTIGGDKV